MELLIVGILLLVVIYFVAKAIKRKKEQSEDFTFEVREATDTTYSQEDEDYDTYLSMLKEATQLKKLKKLDEAVQKIKDALTIYNKDEKGYFKLAYYLQLNKKFDESWQLLVDYLNSLDLRDYFRYHMDSHTVYTEMAKQLKREKKWKDYLYHQALAKYGLHIAFAMQGRVEDLEYLFERLEEDDWFDLSPIKDDDIKKEWRKIIIEFINSKKEQLFDIVHHANTRESRMLMEKEGSDPYLSKINRTLNAGSIGTIYNEKISPLLVDIL